MCSIPEAAEARHAWPAARASRSEDGGFLTRAGVVKAVDDVSFALHRGKVLGLVGESGSGKSVTGFSIMGLVEPPGRITGGQILFDGVDLATLARRGDASPARQAHRDDLPGSDDDAEPGAAHRHPDDRGGAGAREGAARRGAASGARRARAGRHPEPRGASRRLSASVLRRHAPARRDRHRAPATGPT